MTTTEVLVAGAGPVGLALALELGRRGVECVVLDDGGRRSVQPKAKLTNLRSMAHFRRWGLADTVRATAPLPSDYPSDVCFVTRLTGHLLHRFPGVMRTAGRDSRYPEPAVQIPQPLVEKTLRDAVSALPSVTVRRGWRLGTVSASEDSVVTSAIHADTGEDETIEAAWMVGCDGAHSTVRRALGIPMVGAGPLGRSLGVVFDAPALARLHPHGPAVHYWITNQDAPAIMGPLDGAGRWWFQGTGLGGDVEPTTELARSWVAAAVGAEFEFEIIDVEPWTAQSVLAERSRHGRVFLAGDAAHLHPPTGGYGMNMGIGDAVDLGWKLAATVSGWGGAALLDSYEAERRPVHDWVLQEASRNWSVLGGDLGDAADLENDSPAGLECRREVGARIALVKGREFASIGAQLGYRYDSSPVIAPDDTAAFEPSVSEYSPSARPGALAPHAWLADGASLYDTFGPELTLLQLGPDEPDDVSPLLRQAASVGAPVKVVRHDDPFVRRLYEAALVLIRPDQHVAWRGDHLPADAGALVARVRGALPVTTDSRSS